MIEMYLFFLNFKFVLEFLLTVYNPKKVIESPFPCPAKRQKQPRDTLGHY